MAHALRVDDLEAGALQALSFDIDLARLVDQMIYTLESDFEDKPPDRSSSCCSIG
jgi:hypothetical protein